ncbi:MAG: hypothetical protein M3Q30_07550 [Actinomycetota bacterium]|nr:hypothetical protein [Actinomycetota bacterium]
MSRPAAKVRARRSASSVPGLVLVGAALAALFFVVPLAGLVWRAPWSSTWRVLSSAEARAAFRLSLETSVAATAIAVVLGVPLAWVQARVSYPGRNIVRAVTLLPMVLPPVVGGVALLLALGSNGLVGQYLDRVGVHLPFHVAGAVVAETFVSMPFTAAAIAALGLIEGSGVWAAVKATEVEVHPA